MDNPQAFPALHSMTDGVSYSSGMTLRDYFAGQAMINLTLAYSGFFNERSVIISKNAYELADAMLAERNKKCVTE